MSKYMRPQKQKVKIDPSTTKPDLNEILSSVIDDNFTLLRTAESVTTDNNTIKKNIVPWIRKVRKIRGR